MHARLDRRVADRIAPRPRRVLWIGAGADPIRSGELRRMGVPALLIEGDGWTSQWATAATAGTAAPADVAVLSMDALSALPRIAARIDSLIVAVSDTVFEVGAPGVEPLAGLANRLAGVVAHSRRAAIWARRAIGQAAPIWTISDGAVRAPELAAVAMRFGLEWPTASAPDLPEVFDLWFSEPGDRVEEDELRQLAAEWNDAEVARVVVAPRRVRLWLEQLGLSFQGLEWSPERLQAALRQARRCVFTDAVVPGRTRRRAMAFRSGARGQSVRKEVAHAHDPRTVGQRWIEALDSVSGTEARDVGAPLILLDLVQDLDLSLPIIDELATQGHAPRVVVSDWLERRSPRVAVELARRGVVAEVVSREAIMAGQAPDLTGAGAISTPAESNLPAHRRAHALFRRARTAGVPTFSFQHGLENVGLSPIDDEMNAAARLISDHLFVWGDAAAPLEAAPALRPRLVHTGRVTGPVQDASELRTALKGFSSVVAVFENLHWHRYDAAWRVRFLGDCVQFAVERPETAVILKPHHAGLWSVRNAHLIPDWPNNLILADPTEPTWEPFTAPALLQLANLVVTTPSTVALDAAQANLPVAVAAYGMDLPAYAPLPLLQSLSDWRVFAVGGMETWGARARAAFVHRSTTGDAPAQDAVAYMLKVMRERAAARARSSVELSA